MDEVKEYLAKTEESMGLGFGDADKPLLLSVRSGARESMPGMMDTVLNVGLNADTVYGLAKMAGNDHFAWDSYRRLIQMFASLLLGVEHEEFEHALEEARIAAGAEFDSDLTSAQLEELVTTYKNLVLDATGKPFPDDPMEQLTYAIGAVFGSWMNERAILYRDMYSIPEEWGTGVNIQAMVFGNLGDDSFTGVAFTRDPSTGENYFYGEFLPNAQGEDVVAGIRTPRPLAKIGANGEYKADSMEETEPELFGQLNDLRLTLENHYGDIQDIEFTIQQRKVYMLQTRTGKRTAAASVRIAAEMLAEGMIDKVEAVSRVTPDEVESLLHPQLDESAKTEVIATGLPASPGGAVGIAAFDAAKAAEWAAEGKDVLLVRVETSPEDLAGMTVANGILTARGGMTSHAAVVCRQIGRPCVSAVSELDVDMDARTMVIGDLSFAEGEMITIDGSTGEVFLGEIPRMEGGANNNDLNTILAAADSIRRLGVWTNADKGVDALRARELGAEGIGLTRTEHMFFDADRIVVIREAILAEDVAEQNDAISRLLPFQEADFEELFTAMDGLPVTLRLLDPPLHEFLPETDEDVATMAATMNTTVEHIHSTLERMSEVNPMLGHRGCRLGITMPELYKMQAQAIVNAAITTWSKGFDAHPKIMIPLVSKPEELVLMRSLVEEVIAAHASELKHEIPVGTMIELPRACVVAGSIAEHADFFSFGTNDLTQTTFGLSRDDSSTFLPEYQELGIVDSDPFAVLDPEGVGGLVKMAASAGRNTRPDLNIGICGEHGGDPESIHFAHSVGLIDYVSCSPLRVPVARLAAAQAAIAMPMGKSMAVGASGTSHPILSRPKM
jgi:pyruvate,orthophosphate dikinase